MKKVYLDHNATTPLDPRVREKMEPYFREEFGNPSSESHAWGWAAQQAVSEARKQVADFLNCKPFEVIFTSGSTESVNLAITGLALQLILNERRVKPHFLTTTVEHSCVLSAFEFIQKLGADVEIMPVNSYGQLEPETLKKYLRKDTALVSAIWVNNEIGTINSIHELGQISRNNGTFFHTDATQCPGKVKIDLEKMPIDLFSISGHKAYAPKGIGALYIRSQRPQVTLQPFVNGGGQERKVRPGTLNVPGIVGFGDACRILKNEWETDAKKMSELRNHLFHQLKTLFPDIILNGHPTERSPANLNLTIPSFSLDLATPHLIGLAMSRGSACHSGDASGSHVLRSIGVSPQNIERSFRLSLGKTTTMQDIETALEIFKMAKEKVQSQSSVAFKPLS